MKSPEEGYALGWADAIYAYESRQRKNMSTIDGHIAGASFYTPGLPPGVHDLWCVPITAAEEIAELRHQVEAWRKQCDTLTHQVICCGVAASHKDATLSTRGAYAGKWNSAQAEQVRKLRAERDALSRQLDQIIEG